MGSYNETVEIAMPAKDPSYPIFDTFYINIRKLWFNRLLSFQNRKKIVNRKHYVIDKF